MKFARAAALTLTAGILSLGVVSLTAPSASADSSWGCGGFCRTIDQ